MRSLCPDHNLGQRIRSFHLRVSVVLFALALGLGFVIVDRQLSGAFGWLLALPLALGTYSFLAGSFGLCLFAGLKGQRRADHGSELVMDGEERRHMLRRGLVITGMSFGFALGAAALFVSSV
jgi:hypothetical protein